MIVSKDAEVLQVLVGMQELMQALYNFCLRRCHHSGIAKVMDDFLRLLIQIVTHLLFSGETHNCIKV